MIGSYGICYSLSRLDFKEYRHGATECPPPARSDPGAARPHADLPRLRRAALGRLHDPTRPSPPSTASSACGSRSAAAATPTAPAIGVPPPARAGGPLRPARSTSSASTSSPWSARLRHAEHRSVPEIHAELTRRGVPICRAQRHQPAGPLRRAAGPVAAPTPSGCGGSRPTAGPGDPGHRRPAARRRPRGPLGPPRLPLAARSCWPGACCPRRRTTWPQLLARGQGGAWRCRSSGWSPTARTRSARRSPKALAGVPHQLCQFHYLREAAKPIYEADRHAKKELKKKVRGIRPIERKVEGRDDPEARGDPGLLRRGAQRADRRRPAAAGGLGAEAAGPAGGGRREPGPGRGKKGLPKELTRLRAILAQGPGGDRGAVAGRARRPSAGCYRAAAILAQRGGAGRGAAVQATLPRACSARWPGTPGEPGAWPGRSSTSGR